MTINRDTLETVSYCCGFQSLSRTTQPSRTEKKTQKNNETAELRKWWRPSWCQHVWKGKAAPVQQSHAQISRFHKPWSQDAPRHQPWKSPAHFQICFPVLHHIGPHLVQNPVFQRHKTSGAMKRNDQRNPDRERNKTLRAAKATFLSPPSWVARSFTCWLQRDSTIARSHQQTTRQRFNETLAFQWKCDRVVAPSLNDWWWWWVSRWMTPPELERENRVRLDCYTLSWTDVTCQVRYVPKNVQFAPKILREFRIEHYTLTLWRSSFSCGREQYTREATNCLTPSLRWSLQYLSTWRHRWTRANNAHSHKICSSVQQKILSLSRRIFRVNSSDTPFQTYVLSSTDGPRRCVIERSLQSGRISVQKQNIGVRTVACSWSNISWWFIRLVIWVVTTSFSQRLQQIIVSLRGVRFGK